MKPISRQRLWRHSLVLKGGGNLISKFSFPSTSSIGTTASSVGYYANYSGPSPQAWFPVILDMVIKRIAKLGRPLLCLDQQRYQPDDSIPSHILRNIPEEHQEMGHCFSKTGITHSTTTKLYCSSWHVFTTMKEMFCQPTQLGYRSLVIRYRRGIFSPFPRNRYTQIGMSVKP